MRSKRFLGVSCALLFGLHGAALAQTTVTFSHRDTKDGSITEVLSLADGETFVVTVTDTDTSAFEYEVTGISIAGAPRNATTGTTYTVTKEHSTKYGGYYVRVIPTDRGGKPHPTLKAKTWIIATQTIGLHTDINIGLLGTPLVNPKYYLEDGDGTQIVRRDKDAEDDMAFGFASFATVYHDRRPWIGGSVGLGVSDTNVSVLFGPTIRLGQRAAFTVGYHWAHVDRLPNGVHVGDEFDGGSLDLPTHARGEWFFAVSIRGFTDEFKKKLAQDTTTK